MQAIQQHLRNTFLAGILAAIPLAMTAIIVWYVESRTRALFGVHIPFLGILIAIGVIYLLGLILTSLLGRAMVRLSDRLLARIPLFRDLYRAWKQIAITPTGSMGMFARVVLVSDVNPTVRQIGFTSGQPASGDERTWCVFVPAAPNPTSGRLLLIERDRCQPTALSVEEGFKIILSGGNYLPEGLLASATAIAAPDRPARLP